MTQALAPCPTCSRHVQTSEATCPFCKATLPQLTALPGLGPKQRLTRAAALAFTTSLAVAGCSAGVPLPGGGDGGALTGEGGTTGNDSGTHDGGGTDANVPFDSGGNLPPYGLPAYGLPPQDAGKD